ncbi:MAG: hypothetical protein K9H49_13000 [Bacteroidales bacterium]|nr:hypothetical protein [Bacteroidales bacterium]MCF8390393.1 hypothetical protein [Bacteroidales bacterium]
MKKSNLAIFLLLFLCIQGYSQKISLSFNPPTDYEYSTEFDIQSTVNQTIMGIERRVNVSIVMNIHSYVIESNPEYCVVQLQYKKFSIESSDAFVSFTIDSESKSDDPASLIFRSLIDKSFFVSFDRSGEVIDIKGLNSIISDILEGLDPQNPMYAVYEKTLEESFGVNNLRQNFQQLSVAFPSYPVGLNDSWNFSLNSKTTDFDVEMYSTASIKSIGPENVIIQNNSTIVSSHNDSLEIQGMKGKIDMTGSSLSEIQIDPETGLTKSGVVTQEISGDLILQTDEILENEFIIPMKIYSRIRVQNVINQ